MIDRRSVFALFAAPALLATAPALAASSVSVDVSNLRELGVNAARLQAVMERELAGSVAPGTQLVVRVHSIAMPAYAGGGNGAMSGGGTDDSVDSEALVLRNGRVVASYPVLSSSAASIAGPWYAPDIDARRIEAMGRTNADWIRRYVGG